MKPFAVFSQSDVRCSLRVAVSPRLSVPLSHLRVMVCLCTLYFVLCTPCWAGVTTRVSLASDGSEGNDYSGGPSVSADGRFVAFSSSTSNLLPGDTNGTWDVFVHDRQTGQTTRVSVSSGGAQGNGPSGETPAGGYSEGLSISADGRFVAFHSSASNLVPGDTNGTCDVFVHDRQTGQTTRVSVSSGGTQADGSSFNPVISSDGRYVAFHSWVDNLVPGDTNGTWDVFVHDRATGQTSRVSVSTGGGLGNDGSGAPSISADGRFVAFHSSASNLVPGDTNGYSDVFVHDRSTGETTRVSVSIDGMQGNSGSTRGSISADGRHVGFCSYASNLVPGDTNGYSDVFVHDRQTGETTRVSVSSDGAQGNNWSLGGTSISADGRFVAFSTSTSNLVPGDTNGTWDVFVHDRQTGQTTRVSVSSGGAQGNGGSGAPSISSDGRFVAFESAATNLVPGDTNGCYDVFVHDRSATGTPPPEGIPGFDEPSGATLHLRNPYAGQVQRRAKGQLHAHYYNDAEYESGPHYIGASGTGSKFVGDLVNSYADEGYDFVCVTEHNHCSAAPSLCRATYMQYCEEVTTGFGHVLAIGINKQGAGRPEEWRYYPWDTYNTLGEVVDSSPGSVADIVNIIHSAEYGSGVAIVAHPASIVYPVSADEIWKAKPNGISVYTAASFTNSESVWNDLLAAGMFIPTDSGESMLLFGATEDDFTPPITPHAHGRTWVIAELDSADLTQENIIKALRNARYWSYWSLRHYGTGPILHLATSTNAEGKPVIQVTSDIPVNDIAFVYRKKDIGTVETHHLGLLNYAEYPCEGDEIFVRVEVTAGDIKVYSQPVAVVWEWESGGGGGGWAMGQATTQGAPSDLVLTCALPEQLPAKNPPMGYIGRAYFASTTSGTYPEGSTLTLSYEGIDVTPYGTSNLALYRWDAGAGNWAKLASTVDIGNALVTAPLTQAGLYTISAEIVGDASAPTVSIYSPSDGATLTGPDVIGVQAYDNVGVLRTSFYLNDQCIGVDSTSFDGYTCEFDFGRKSAGAYSLKVTAEDVSGNVGEAEVAITIASSGVTPIVTITSPTSGSTLEGVAVVTGTCDDDSLVTGVFVLADGIPVGEASVSGGTWTYDLDTALLANGPHTLSAMVMDNDQNTFEQGIGVTVTGATLSSLAESKLLADGERARVTGRVVTFGDPGHDGTFYIEEQDRFAGLRVQGSLLPWEADMVSVSGLMSTVDGERTLVGADVLMLSSSNPVPPPLTLTNRNLGGGPFGLYVPGIMGAFGLNNIGLLITASGAVTHIGTDCLYIDDGSNLKDGTYTDTAENVGVRVICDPTGYNAGDYLFVTGISSCFETPSGIVRRILTRKPEDMWRLSP